jgi:hypothetical protein
MSKAINRNNLIQRILVYKFRYISTTITRSNPGVFRNQSDISPEGEGIK